MLAFSRCVRPLSAAAAAAAAAAATALSSARCDSKPTRCDSKSKVAPPKSLNEVVASLALRSRIVFLSGRIDDDAAKSVIAQLIFLEQDAPGRPIQLHINSGGGSVQAGLAIHDVMQAVTAPVITSCLGHCESMAAVLLAAGESGERSALPNARIMIHQPVRGGSSTKSNAKQAAISAASIEKSRLKLAELLAARTGRPLAEIEAMLEYDTVLDAEGARELGLIDRVGGERGGFVRLPSAAAEEASGAAGTAAAVRAAEAGAAQARAERAKVKRA